MIKEAENFIKMGFSVLPINSKKQPLISSWTTFQTRLPEIREIAEGFNSAFGLAIITGRVSGNLEVIDVDTKYDLTGKMFREFCDEVKQHNGEVLYKLTVAKTMNGGFHLIYRVPEEILQGNQKLAKRPATKEEIALGDKVKVLFETRGEGGYIAAAPTPGYEVKRGGFERVQTLTEQERDILFAVARTFDTMPVEYFPQEAEIIRTRNGLSPFEEFNDSGNIPALLESHGWKRVYQRGNRIHFKRPGTTDSAVSANFDIRRRIFYVFSTSTEFNAERGYNPTQVYTILECGGDYSEASKQLSKAGYGKRKTKIEYVERKKQSSGLYQWYQAYKAQR